MAVIADDMISHSTVETKAQRVAAQVNAACEGEAPAYAARIAAKGAGAQEQRRDKSRHLDNVIRAFVFDDASEIVVDGAAWSVKDPNKQPERSYPPTIYVVLNEHTLGYVQTPDSRIMGVSHGSVLRGGRDWRNGGVFVIPGIDSLRPATVEDFDDYRVQAPPNFRPVTAEELGTYRIMSPIVPCPEEEPEPNGPVFR